MKRDIKGDLALESYQRKVLVVEDNELNREILSAILGDEYEVLEAENGQVGLDVLAQHYRDLSLIILDVYMPVCTGFEFLERIADDALLSSVPVIVATGSENPEDEVRCLQMGASDFVTKPYNPEVVLGRVRSIIKLHESMNTLSAVEYDSLTGLYTMSAFYHHVAEELKNHPNQKFDLTVADLCQFKILNSVLGDRKCDEALKYLGSQFSPLAGVALVAREGDKFFVFYAQNPHFTADQGYDFWGNAIKNAPIQGLKVKMGVYVDVDKSVSVPQLCDRAIMAAASIKGDFTQNIAFYDQSIQDKQKENIRLENAFAPALAAGEFQPWLQPKVDPITGKIVAAEALVRWIPEPGKMISPGAFIPLFERDGLVVQLDEYIFECVCALQKQRINAGKPVVPISLNLSRNSMYEPGVMDRYKAIVERIGIPQSLVPLELTESAVADNRGVTELVGRITAAGFSLHMDDFGTGYSSLASLTNIPFEVIKLDKSLSDQIGTAKGNPLIRHMISMAHEMGIYVVAEGVEERAQVDFLRDVNCDMIQGYFYSPPRPMATFEEMLDADKEAQTLDLNAEYNKMQLAEADTGFELDAQSLANLQRISEELLEGFFTYRASSDETLLHANKETLRIFGCETMDEFRTLTGNSFKGMVHPDDYVRVEQSIFEQINASDADVDAVEYRITRKDGEVIWVKDRGHCVHTQAFGNVFYVFIIERD